MTLEGNLGISHVGHFVWYNVVQASLVAISRWEKVKIRSLGHWFLAVRLCQEIQDSLIRRCQDRLA